MLYITLCFQNVICNTCFFLKLNNADSSRIHPQRAVIKLSRPAQFICNSYLRPQWFHNNVSIQSSSEKQNVLYIPHVERTSSGTYECIGITSTLKEFHATAQLFVRGK